jgi:hypothetical protein
MRNRTSWVTRSLTPKHGRLQNQLPSRLKSPMSSFQCWSSLHVERCMSALSTLACVLSSVFCCRLSNFAAPKRTTQPWRPGLPGAAIALEPLDGFPVHARWRGRTGPHRCQHGVGLRNIRSKAHKLIRFKVAFFPILSASSV